MVLVELYFPALNKSFDFLLSHDMPIGVLVDEMLEMICQNERLPSLDDKNDKSVLLYDKDNNRLLDPQMTLEGYQIRNAAKLILV